MSTPLAPTTPLAPLSDEKSPNMSMSLLPEQIKMLQSVFESLKEMVIHTVNLDFHENGLELMYMTSTHVAIVYLFLGKSSFFKYACEQTRTIGIRLQDVLAAIRACRETKQLRIEIPSDGASLVFITEPINGQREVRYTLDGLDTDGAKLKIPQAQWKQTIQMPTKDLKEIVRTFDFTSELRIQWRDGVLRFSASEENKTAEIAINTKPRGEDAAPTSAPSAGAPPLDAPTVPQLPPLMGAPTLGGCGGTVDAAPPEPAPIDAPQHLSEVDALFPMRYLKWFTKTEGLGNSMVRLLLKPDFPLCLTYELATDGVLTFVLNASEPEDEDAMEDELVPYDSGGAQLFD